MKRLSALLIAWLALPLVGSAQSAGPVAAGRPVLVIDPGGHTRFVKDVAFTADGRQLVSGGDDKVIRVWDVASGKTVRTIRGQIGAGAEGTIYALALSPDNKYLAVGGSFPGAPDESFAVRLHDFESGRVIDLLKGHQNKVIALAFSRDSRRLVSGGDDKRVLVWDIAQGDAAASSPAPREVGRHGDVVSAVAFSPDGTMVVSGGDDTLVRLWELGDGAQGGRLVGEMTRHVYAQVSAVAFSPDGRYIASGGLDDRVFLWGWKGGSVRELGRMKSDVLNVAFTPPDGSGLLVGTKDGSCAVISVASGKVTSQYGHNDDVWAVAVSPDGKTAATAGGYDGEIALWSTETGKPMKTLAGVGKAIRSVGFARDGKSVAFGTGPAPDGASGELPLQQVIQLVEGDKYLVSLGGPVKNQADYVRAVTKAKNYELRTKVGPRTPAGQIVADDLLEVFDGKTAREPIRRTPLTGYRHKSYTFTHDGSYIISGGENGYLTIYETETGKVVEELRGHTNDVISVAVSPDDRFLVSGSSDQTVRLWALPSGQNLLSVFVANDGNWVAWTPYGYYTSSIRGDRYIGWQVNSGPKLTPALYTAAQYRASFDRPDVVGWFLAERNIKNAVRLAGVSPKIFDLLRDYTDARFGGDLVLSAIPPDITYQIEPGLKDGKVSQQTVILRVKVNSKTLPIKTVRVLLNGAARGTLNGDPGDKAGSLQMAFEMKITLKEGDNSLHIIASNEMASSKPQVININYQPPGGGGFIRPDEPDRSDGGSRPAGPPVYFRSARLSAAATPPRPATPTVNILSPVEGVPPTNNKNLLVRIEAYSDNPPTDVEVKRKGERVDFFRISSTGTPSEVNVVLDPGENELTVTAFNGGVAVATATRKITYQEVEKPKLVFLGIGVSTYKVFRPNLEFAARDAEDLAALLRQQKVGDGRYFGDVQAEVISNEKVTRTEIIRKLEWMNREAKGGDDVRVVLISGHAGLTPSGYYFFSHLYNTEESPEEHSMAAATFWRLLSANNTKLVFLVDTCRAGGAAPKDFIKGVALSNAIFIGSSSEDQKSKEDPEKGHGYLTWATLEALGGKADYNNDGSISNEELVLWVKEEVRKLTNEKQEPEDQKPDGLKKFTVTACPTIPCPKGNP